MAKNFGIGCDVSFCDNCRYVNSYEAKPEAADFFLSLPTFTSKSHIIFILFNFNVCIHTKHYTKHSFQSCYHRNLINYDYGINFISVYQTKYHNKVILRKMVTVWNFLPFCFYSLLNAVYHVCICYGYIERKSKTGTLFFFCNNPESCFIISISDFTFAFFHF